MTRPSPSGRNGAVRDALRLLDIERFALSIHDRSFPSFPHEDSGRGTPYSHGGLAFLEFARDLGFNTIQLGPQGLTSRSDHSPYGSSVFARDPLLLAASTLPQTEEAGPFIGPGDAATLYAAAGGTHRTDRVDYAAAWRYADALLDTAAARLAAMPPRRRRGFEAFRRSLLERRIDWLRRDSLYEILSTITKSDNWQLWGPPAGEPIDPHLYSRGRRSRPEAVGRIESLLRDHAGIAERFQLCQYLLRMQHGQFKGRVAAMGLEVFGDVQIGFSHRDRWAWAPLFLEGYLLGAPPSRSNIEGQPWGYPVLDPRLMHHDETPEHGNIAHAFIEERFDTLLDEFHGLRIDHPHGLVCPWVYRADDPDPFHAVQNGARLNCAPGLPDHPELARFSLVNPDQLDTSGRCRRYDDDYVRNLRPEQIEQFDSAIATILSHAAARGVKQSAILCEVLSTWPSPLKAVMLRHGLGRFCVTQKADPANPHDVYRSENTGPNDWIMVGTHDTRPLWNVVATQTDAWRRGRAGLLARQMSAEPAERERLYRTFTADKASFTKAMFTELFLAPARNISVFFPDLFGMDEPYNQPGTVGPHNWTLRVPRDYRRLYDRRCERGEAFDIAACLAMALRIRARDTDEGDTLALARRLDPDERSWT